MFWLRLWIGILLSLPIAHRALAQAPCPTVSTETSVLNPAITGAPKQVALAIYDLNTGGLTVQFAGPGNKATYFVGVSRSLIVGKVNVPWVSIVSYPQAVVQEGSTCPLLNAAGTPILSTGNAAVTRAPFVNAPCPLVSDGTAIYTASIQFPPYTIYRAVYDPKTQYLIIQFIDSSAVLFENVPNSVASGVIQWNTLFQYSEAIMAQSSGCPLLSQ